MRLATRANGTPDGELVAVSADYARCLPAGGGWPNLREALENWEKAEPELVALAARLDAGEGEALDEARLIAPLPRAWQWLDGSAFQAHADLMQVAFGHERIEHERPLMYQGMSDRFLGPREDAKFPDVSIGRDRLRSASTAEIFAISIIWPMRTRTAAWVQEELGAGPGTGQGLTAGSPALIRSRQTSSLMSSARLR